MPFKSKTMKKIPVILSIALISTALFSCGPSAEELAAQEQARLDSIAQVTADSLLKVTEDSLAAVQLFMEDSIAAAEKQLLEDSIAALTGQVKGMQSKAKATKAKEKKKEKDLEQIMKGKG